MKEFPLNKAQREKLEEALKRARTVKRPESSLGQWIGYMIDSGTQAHLQEITDGWNAKRNTAAWSSGPKWGEPQVVLQNSLGQSKQIDHVVREGKKNRLIIEAKWLKDKRHLNDKGSWILMMADILSENPDLYGIVTVLAGPWESYREVFEKKAEVIIAPLDEVYGVLRAAGINIPLDESRNAYKDPAASLQQMINKVDERAKVKHDLVTEVGYHILAPYQQELIQKMENLLFGDR